MNRSLSPKEIRLPVHCILLFFLLLIGCNDDPPDVPDEEPLFAVETGNSRIPYLIIDTKGAGILNEPKVAAELTIYENKIPIQQTPIGIEFRGSTSFRLSDKKSYGIETWDPQGNDVDVSFFDFPEEEDFILGGHIVNMKDGYMFDPTLMYNYFAYNLYAKLGWYSSRTKFVELEINGEYQGVYVFMEKLKRDKNRIDIKRLEPGDTDTVSITGGYILKIDKTAGGNLNQDQPLEYFYSNWADDARYTEENSFRSQYDIYGKPLDFTPYGEPYHPNQYLETYFLYEYPKASEITAQQKQYIQQYIDDFETALLNDDFSSETRTYTDFIDLSSFVDYFIVNEICRNVDAYRLSTFLYKDRGGRLTMGPVWDMDIGYFNGDRVPLDGWVINYNDYVYRDPWMMPFWWPRLMEDPVFTETLKLRWTELRAGLLAAHELLAMVDETAGYLLENRAIDRNYAVWGVGFNINYTGIINELKSYLEQRTSWMDQEIDGL